MSQLYQVQWRGEFGFDDNASGPMFLIEAHSPSHAAEILAMEREVGGWYRARENEAPFKEWQVFRVIAKRTFEALEEAMPTQGQKA